MSEACLKVCDDVEVVRVGGAETGYGHSFQKGQTGVIVLVDKYSYLVNCEGVVQWLSPEEVRLIEDGEEV